MALLLLGLAVPGWAQLAPGQGMYPEDSVHATQHYGVFSLAVRKDTATALCGADGDYCGFIVDGVGRAWTRPVFLTPNGDSMVDDTADALKVTAASLPLPTGAATSANQSTIIGHVDGLETLLTGIDADTNNIYILNSAMTSSLSVLDDWDDGSDRARVVGAAAEDAAAAGNPVSIGYRAEADRRTAMTDAGDVVRPAADLYGRARTTGVAMTVAFVQATASGNTTLISAPSSGSKLRVYRVELSNSHATAAITVGVRFGAAGTIFGKAYLPAVGGAKVIALGSNHVEGADAEAFIVNLSGAGQIECTVYYETVDVS